MEIEQVTTWLRTLPKDEAAQWLAKVLPEFLDQQYFELWESHGFHITRNDYLSPIPDVQSLSPAVWQHVSGLPGIDLNLQEQRQLLRDVFPRFRSEYDQFPNLPGADPHEFYFDNAYFSGTDALVLYCMVRHLRPRQIIEVGSGFSSLLSAAALRRNGKGRLRCIEPHPSEVLHELSGLDELHVSKVEDLGYEIFLELGPGDILFIDSSHVSRIAGDVNFLFLEVLPRLAPGVAVHVHDIFLPYEYKEEWIREQHLFWTEQYLLQAFLVFNEGYRILFANSLVAHHFSEEMMKTFPRSPWWGGGSFWMQRQGLVSS